MRQSDARLALLLRDYLRHTGNDDSTTALQELTVLVDGWHPRDGYGR